MSIEWENILPKKTELFPLAEKGKTVNTCDYYKGRNQGILDCLEVVKSAETRGEICKSLSVEEIEAILFEDDPQGARTPHGQAEAIHRAMTNKGG